MKGAQQPSTGGAQPTDSVTEQIDRKLASEALRKLQQNLKPTREERNALKRVEKAREEKLRWQYYRAIPLKHWQIMSGRQAKIIKEQAALYGLPCGEAEIDLPKFVRAFHDFLAAHGRKLVKDEEGLLSGPATESMERLRRIKAIREEFAYERDRGLWRSIEEVQTGLNLLASIVRQACENLQRQFGSEALELVAEAFDDGKKAFQRILGGDDDLESDHGDASGDGSAAGDASARPRKTLAEDPGGLPAGENPDDV